MSDKTFVGSTAHITNPEVFVEEIGGRVCIFMEKEGPIMFGLVSSFSKFVGFIVSNNIRVDLNFLYSKSVGSLL